MRSSSSSYNPRTVHDDLSSLAQKVDSASHTLFKVGITKADVAPLVKTHSINIGTLMEMVDDYNVFMAYKNELMQLLKHNTNFKVVFAPFSMENDDDWFGLSLLRRFIELCPSVPPYASPSSMHAKPVPFNELIDEYRDSGRAIGDILHLIGSRIMNLLKTTKGGLSMKKKIVYMNDYIQPIINSLSPSPSPPPTAVAKKAEMIAEPPIRPTVQQQVGPTAPLTQAQAMPMPSLRQPSPMMTIPNSSSSETSFVEEDEMLLEKNKEAIVTFQCPNCRCRMSILGVSPPKPPTVGLPPPSPPA